MALTARQKRFAEEYIVDLNASQAAIRAGFSVKASRQSGARLLSNVDIQAYIRELMDKRAERVHITQDMVLRELAKIGFSDIRKVVKWGETMVRSSEGDEGEEMVPYHGLALVDSDDVDESTAGAIAEVSQGRDGLKVKLHDKKGALVDIGRHLGMFGQAAVQDLDVEIRRAELENKRLVNAKLRKELEGDNNELPEPKQVFIGVADASDPDAE